MTYDQEITRFVNRARTRIAALSPAGTEPALAQAEALSGLLLTLADNLLPADRQLRLVHLLSASAGLTALGEVDYGAPLLPMLPGTPDPSPAPAPGSTLIQDGLIRAGDADPAHFQSAARFLLY